MLRVSERERRELRLPWRSLVASKLDEYRIKLSGEVFKGMGMIGADPVKVTEGFKNLQGDDFARYNYPQVWVERRQIPRAIDARIPERGATVLDLGCGPGTSTEVLCHFADPTWQIIGYDLTQGYIDQARARAARGGFVSALDEVIRPNFIRQDIGGVLLSPTGGRLTPGSVDFAMSGGVVGLYMTPRGVKHLLGELVRALRPGGFAALDSGPACPPRRLREMGIAAGLEYHGRISCCFMDPRPKVLFSKNG